jgi:hypothetical protein
VQDETGMQPAGGIVDHADQVEFWPALFQPLMFAGIPLHQFPASRPRWRHAWTFSTRCFLACQSRASIIHARTVSRLTVIW